jgi:hypothetical protein
MQKLEKREDSENLSLEEIGREELENQEGVTYLKEVDEKKVDDGHEVYEFTGEYELGEVTDFADREDAGIVEILSEGYRVVFDKEDY